MTLATTPTNRIAPLTPRFEMIVNRRWKEWEAATLVWMQSRYIQMPLMARAMLYGINGIEIFQKEHHKWMTTLLCLGVPLKSIRKWNIDDPRERRDVLEQRVAEYIERRQRRHKR